MRSRPTKSALVKLNISGCLRILLKSGIHTIKYAKKLPKIFFGPDAKNAFLAAHEDTSLIIV